jgi:hypothetical protein
VSPGISFENKNSLKRVEKFLSALDELRITPSEDWFCSEEDNLAWILGECYS